jgi:hypothetical protein
VNEPKAPPAAGSDDLLLVAAMVVAFPVAILVWVTTLLVIRRHGISRWWAGLAAAATGVTMYLAGAPQAALGASTAALGAFTVTGWTVRELVAAMVGVLGRVGLSTALVAVPVGLMAAAITATPLAELPGVPSPALRRRAARRAKRETRRVDRAASASVGARVATERPAVLGVLAGKGDLPPDWTQGKYLVLPTRSASLPRLVVGRPGQGKSVYLAREVYLAGLDHRQAVVVDCKGQSEFADEVEAAYRAGWELVAATNSPTVHRWPDEPLNAWTGGPTAVANRLLSVWTFDLASLWYREVVDMALNLAMAAPGDPITSSRQVLQRVQPDVLTRLWQDHPEETALARSVGPKLDDVNIRLGNLLSKLGGLLDGTRAIGTSDLTILSLPTMGQEHQAESILRVALADLAHYVSSRKLRVTKLLIVVDEFSAVPGGREHAVHLSERGRSAGAATVLAVQSSRGLGDDDDADRIIGAAGMIALFGTAEPERILKLAGTINVGRQTVTVGNVGGYTSTYSEATEYRVDGNDVRALEPGYAYILASGRAQRIKVIPAPGGDRPQPIIDGTLHPSIDPGDVADERELPGPVQPRQEPSVPSGRPAAALDPPGPGRVRRHRSPPAGEEHPPDDHHNQEVRDAER